MYQREYAFLSECFAKCRIRLHEIAYTDILQTADLASSTFEDVYLKYWLRQNLLSAQKNIVYRFVDPIGCHFIFLLLPDRQEKTVLVIGPYITEEQREEQLLIQAEKISLPPKLFRQLKEYCSAVPLISDVAAIFAMLEAYFELIFGGSDQYFLVELGQQEAALSPAMISEAESKVHEGFAQRRAQLELRYYYEQQLYDAVRHGLTHKAELMFNGFNHFSIEQRLSDPMRNLKNYCIIMNTVCRKAAEEGGVHPFYLDQTSSDFARQIEQKRNEDEIKRLVYDMFRSYCRLVRRHLLKEYSKPVQLAILQIDTDLASDLSLSSLAASQELSPSYLSALFKKETGQTITAYVNERRMKMAMQLLENTLLQVQTVAQYCGILDVHYFARLFKKYTGQTPKEYRDKKSRTTKIN